MQSLFLLVGTGLQAEERERKGASVNNVVKVVVVVAKVVVVDIKVVKVVVENKVAGEWASEKEGVSSMARRRKIFCEQNGLYLP